MSKLRMLLFNLATDTDEPALGFTTTWINALAARCEIIDVLTMQAGRLSVSDNVRVFSDGRERGYSKPHRVFEFYRVLLRLLCERRYDICFAHMAPLYTIMAKPLLRLYRIPVVLWYAHGTISLMLRIAEKLADRIVTSTVEGFRLPSNKLVVIGQGIDTTVFAPPIARYQSDQTFTIAAVGRIAPIKKLDILIEAVWLLVHNNGLPDIRLQIVGGTYPKDRWYEEKLKDRVNQLHLNRVVDFRGPVPFEHIVRVYQEADVTVNLSQTGSLDKAILESMSCGVPAVTSNEAARPILQRWTDILLFSANDPETLALRLKAIMTLELKDRQQLALALRQVVIKHHSLDQLATRLDKLLLATTSR